MTHAEHEPLDQARTPLAMAPKTASLSGIMPAMMAPLATTLIHQMLETHRDPQKALTKRVTDKVEERAGRCVRG